LAAGADVDTISPDERRTAVQMATRSVNIELVQILLKEGADVNICTAGRWHGNAIQEAARSGNMELVSVLLDAPANVDACSIGEKETALQIAAWYGNTKIIRLLLNAGANVNQPVAGKSGRTTL
jgi:ankyrin repeat protein